MKNIAFAAVLALIPGLHSAAFAQEHSSIAEIQDRLLHSLERELVPAAEAMPADKYNFAPKDGSFEGVRTFAQQIRHIAVVNDMIASVLLGEKQSMPSGESENGPDDKLNNKDAIVAFLKQSFAHAHQANKTLTDQNATEVITMQWGKVARLYLSEEMVAHSMDHYGQVVEYLRLNGIVPPASRPQSQ